ncbi:hypothetical protein HHL23_09390 [Chryseobacterium sp. RP-3-3]|uniref:Uncharacterized protein n=1 Tax=Chryseobacterium antibioticum TaxID=2728847 RepID=A0A7Y0AME5_9FLAO|nr:hypothetical protein [Chryseobacterium antibioticum]NML70013.1 hypothetical protein [Chryseobacterium antibioticum]
MTKEQKIQEAYGERYDSLKSGINTDGIYVGDTELLTDEEFNNWNFIGKAKNIGPGKYVSGSRPTSLSGIENNNGWIKIESEDDLPVSGKYKVISTHYSKSIIAKYARSGNTWLPVGTDDRRFIEVTHYKAIIEDKPPIY